MAIRPYLLRGGSFEIVMRSTSQSHVKHHDLHLSMFFHQALALHAEWVASMPKPGDGAALQISGVMVVEDFFDAGISF